jgi:hypothetical protein
MFVVGIPTKSTDDLEIDENLQREIENEFDNFGDILQVTKPVVDCCKVTVCKPSI